MDPRERNQQQAERAILAQEFEKKTEEERNQWRAAQNNIISNIYEIWDMIAILFSYC